MDVFANLKDDQRELLVRLPYRVGYWISAADSKGGEQANIEENRALENIIDGITREVFGSETVHRIMNETVTRKDEWPGWRDNPEKIESECVQALKIMSDRLDRKELQAFKMRLIDIAEAVALAFREETASDVWSRIGQYIDYGINTYLKRGDARNTMPFHQYLNISPAEKNALKKLSKSLQMAG